MPKKKKLYVDMPKLLLYEAVDHCLFSYVLGMQRAMPSVGIAKAVELFIEEFGLDEDTYPLEHAKITWYRMVEDYRNFRKLDN